MNDPEKGRRNSFVCGLLLLATFFGIGVAANP